MVTKMTFRHIGYYNDYEDVKNLFGRTANFVVQTMLDGLGAFHSVPGESETDIDDPKFETDADKFVKTDNGNYLVRFERGNNNGEGWFIDIYKLMEVEVEDTSNEVEDEEVYEYCPYCENEVVLDNELKVQVCPECGHAIVPCNICPLDDCCSHCPLDALCRQRNEDDYREMPLDDFLESFINEPPLHQSLGFNIRIDYKDKEKNILTFDYEFEKGLYRLYNLSESGKAFTWKEIPSPGTLFDGLWNVTGEEMDTIYVKPNF